MKKINAAYEEVCAKYSSFKHIWVDTDKHPTIKFYYDVKVEPTFVILLNGGELTRVVGDDFEELVKLYEKYDESTIIKPRTIDLHTSEFKYIGNSKGTYEDFENYPLRVRRSLNAPKDPFNYYNDKWE